MERNKRHSQTVKIALRSFAPQAAMMMISPHQVTETLMSLQINAV